MNRSEAEKRIACLRQELHHYDYLYYVMARPEVTDRQYDLLYKELEDLEEIFPDLITPQSPTQRVGGQPIEGFKHVQHLSPMLSLDNVFYMESPNPKNKKDLRRFDNTICKKLSRQKIEYVLEPKVDGVSVSLRYEGGHLTLAATRGDGTIGDDITANIRTLRVIPLTLPSDTPPRIMEVRGEVYMDIADFHKMNQALQSAGEDPFENARNATAGSLKNLDPRVVASRPLKAIFYALGASRGITVSTQDEVLEELSRLGLPTQKYYWRCRSMEEVFQRTAELEGLRDQIPYEIDGAVVKVNDLSQWKSLGETSKSPRYAVAYKFLEDSPENRAITKLLAISVQVGRTGTLTPVAELEPVSLAGSTISRATLHNEDEIKRKDIRIGDTLVIKKAGMVIPAVLEVVKEKRPHGSQPFDFMNHIQGQCPECGGPVSRDPNYSAWRCENLQCPAQNIRRIEHFSSRGAMDIEGLGGIVAEKLVESGLVTEPLDLFELTLPNLSTLNLGTKTDPRILGEKNAARLLKAVHICPTFPLSRWLYALGIPKMGKTLAYKIARFHRDINDVATSRILKIIVELENSSIELKQLRARSRGPQEGERKEQEAPTCEEVRNRIEELWFQLQEDMEARANELTELQGELSALKKRLKKDQQQVRQQLEQKTSEIQILEGRLKSLSNQPEDTRTTKSTPITAEAEGQLLEKLRELRLDRGKLKSSMQRLEARRLRAGLPNDVGPVVAQTVLDFFASQAGQAILKRLSDLDISPKEVVSPEPGRVVSPRTMTGKTFVLTGSLAEMTRDEATGRIRALGGTVTSSLSRKTSFLVMGSDPGAKKINQANSSGIPVIEEQEFLEMLEDGEVPAATESPEQEELF